MSNGLYIVLVIGKLDEIDALNLFSLFYITSIKKTSNLYPCSCQILKRAKILTPAHGYIKAFFGLKKDSNNNKSVNLAMISTFRQSFKQWPVPFKQLWERHHYHVRPQLRCGDDWWSFIFHFRPTFLGTQTLNLDLR